MLHSYVGTCYSKFVFTESKYIILYNIVLFIDHLKNYITNGVL